MRKTLDESLGTALEEDLRTRSGVRFCASRCIECRKHLGAGLGRSKKLVARLFWRTATFRVLWLIPPRFLPSLLGQSAGGRRVAFLLIIAFAAIGIAFQTHYTHRWTFEPLQYKPRPSTGATGRDQESIGNGVQIERS